MKLTQDISSTMGIKVRRCSLKWLFSQSKYPKLPVESEAAEIGLGVHESIKIYFDNIVAKPSEHQIRELATSMFEATMGTLGAKEKTCLANFIKFEIDRLKTWKEYKPKYVEQRLLLKPEDLEKMGIKSPTKGNVIIDFYGSNTQIDWKTGNVSFIDFDERFQLAFNNMFLSAYGENPLKSYIVSLYNGVILEMPHTPTEWVIQQWHEILSNIEHDKFFPTKSFLCNYCEYILRCEFRKNCLWQDF